MDSNYPYNFHVELAQNLKEDKTMQRVALLGIGIMGSGMAANWLKAGFALTVYNRTRSKAEPLSAQGARVANSPQEAAQDADIIVSMVTDDNASREVWLGENGALNGVRPNTLIIESSTVTPNWIRELATYVEAKNCEMLDVPVTGSKAAAANAQLVLLVGGSAETLERARPALAAISREINHLGEIGMGATWKLINNMMAAVHLAVLAEGLALAEKTGLDVQQVAALTSDSASASPMVKGKLPRIMEHNYSDPDFALSNILKDVTYAGILAEQVDIPLNVVHAAAQLYQQAVDQGLGNQDLSAVAEVL
jgi:3-hydroxyisobutyrate dehydrogenase